mmetsp:Transcript_12993/g.41011  ORF Transcript_12993/g.41011 Transcript_12993/m.41011 type:complete len:233 (+) Transcript_12993:197-895(+)
MAQQQRSTAATAITAMIVGDRPDPSSLLVAVARAPTNEVSKDESKEGSSVDRWSANPGYVVSVPNSVDVSESYETMTPYRATSADGGRPAMRTSTCPISSAGSTFDCQSATEPGSSPASRDPPSPTATGRSKEHSAIVLDVPLLARKGFVVDRSAAQPTAGRRTARGRTEPTGASVDGHRMTSTVTPPSTPSSPSKCARVTDTLLSKTRGMPGTSNHSDCWGCALYPPSRGA